MNARADTLIPGGSVNGEESIRESLQWPPQSSAILRSFTCAGAADDRFSVIVYRMRTVHDEQWNTEDSCRTQDIDDHDLASAKRRIDELNKTRSELIDKIDGWAEGVVHKNSAPLHTETLGTLVDRMCIAWIRTEKLSAAMAPARAEIASRQLDELATAYDTLRQEVLGGRKQFPRWRTLKSYGDS